MSSLTVYWEKTPLGYYYAKTHEVLIGDGVLDQAGQDPKILSLEPFKLSRFLEDKPSLISFLLRHLINEDNFVHDRYWRWAEGGGNTRCGVADIPHTASLHWDDSPSLFSSQDSYFRPNSSRPSEDGKEDARFHEHARSAKHETYESIEPLPGRPASNAVWFIERRLMMWMHCSLQLLHSRSGHVPITWFLLPKRNIQRQ